jgi:hypothetical protein
LMLIASLACLQTSKLHDKFKNCRAAIEKFSCEDYDKDVLELARLRAQLKEKV